MSDDQAAMNVKMPATLNRYVYSVDDPINYIDKSGNMAISIDISGTDPVPPFIMESIMVKKINIFCRDIGNGVFSAACPCVTIMAVAAGVLIDHLDDAVRRFVRAKLRYV